MDYANFWYRVTARLIDTIIIQIIYSIATEFILLFSDNIQEVITHLNLLLILGILFGWLYYSLMESSAKQATIGKMMLGIYVTDLQGKRISFSRATGRYFSNYISALTFGIGYLMVNFTKKKQALHDIMAGCLIVKERK
ncbi:RDD family protein [Gloeocapsopsis dulcis]|uniref:RDD domain-containing protein n=1 Tax=Gloeocapsopsis dulcis AAB1 = 1H9 TaxID=1433147 RepID=A0A6N8FQA4_9CHRO|nr:RDD family protein [Gloeocapsopsis dulcis]MUL35024.1 hypothetical protein [Gloeocapsopsis dulcis AAB1 = 1H9]WNN89901.1 RDD family protein [Gloeocapsopsis dulcis]